MQPKKQKIRLTASKSRGTIHNSARYEGFAFRALMSIMRMEDSDLVSFSIHNDKGMPVHVMITESEVVLSYGKEQVRVRMEGLKGVND